MRIMTHGPAAIVLLAMVASLVGVITPSSASAAESIPDLQYPAISIGQYYNAEPVTGPDGSITIPCTDYMNGTDLRSYDASGQLIRHIPRSPRIDGVDNCLREPAIDKDGTLYGVPWGETDSGGSSYGSNLLAYDGNTLKWKYPLACSSNGGASYVVGADGNIYATTRESNGDVHLIGLTPEVAPPLTGPDKVLDVVIPVSCATKIYAYKDGIMVHDQLHGHGRYYSYGGKYLGQASIGSIWYEKLNADGQLFVSSYVYGSGFRSVNISMYDPLTGKVMWTTPSSTSGADTNGVWLTPLAGGGVAAIIKEQKMIAPSIPATPEEWVYTFVIVNAAGQKVKSIQLANEDSQGTTYGRPSLSTDSGGKVMMLRDMSMDTQISWPNTVPGISIGVYDLASDTWTYAEVMKGDVNHPDDPYGYRLESDGQLTADTVTFMAKCSQNCPNNDYDYKVYSVEVNGLGVDYPRGDVLNADTPQQPSPVPYVALGDSFSSGEGVLPFEPESDDPGENECHRSELAYAKLVGRNPEVGASLVTGRFAACSGAETKHVTTTEKWDDEGLQKDRLNAYTKVVTITIGGNDIKFTDFATDCVLYYCGVGSNAYNTSLGEINNNLGAKLTATYQAILNAAPNAQIYVLGYPQVTPDKPVDDPPPPSSATCAYLYDFGGTAGWGEAQAARHIVAQLNAKISAKVTAESSPRLHFIDPNASGSPFVGHTVCADEADSYFNNLDTVIGGKSFVFHPNALGQAAYAVLVTEALR